MADYNSSLPVRTETNGDVAVKLVDGTTVSQAAAVSAAGAVSVTDTSDGSVTGGTAGTTSQLAGGIYETTPPTLTNGQQVGLQVDVNGRLMVDSMVIFPYDFNWGTVGATTLRTAAEIGNATGAANFNFGTVNGQTLQTAAQIGNATGAADFNAGATDAQTLRTSANQGTPNTVANAWPIEVTNGTNTAFVTAPSTAATAAESALVVALSPGTPLPAGSNVIGAVTQSGGPWSVTLPYDENYGTVGATTLRTAAQIGNATGAADFSFGAVGAQTLRTAAEVGNATGAADFNFGAVGAQTLRVASEVGNATGAADFNWGTVGAQTLRTAAEIGNATGAADFNAGASTAQTLRVAANLYSSTGTAFSSTNPLPVTMDTVLGTAVDDYKDATAIASNASDNHDYTVTAGKTLYFNQVIAAASGKAKMLVAVETGVGTGIFTTKFVQFNSTAETNMDVTLITAIAVAAGVRVRVTMTNTDKSAQDMYSTICGYEI